MTTRAFSPSSSTSNAFRRRPAFSLPLTSPLQSLLSPNSYSASFSSSKYSGNFSDVSSPFSNVDAQVEEDLDFVFSDIPTLPWSRAMKEGEASKRMAFYFSGIVDREDAVVDSDPERSPAGSPLPRTRERGFTVPGLAKRGQDMTTSPRGRRASDILPSAASGVGEEDGKWEGASADSLDEDLWLHKNSASSPRSPQHHPASPRYKSVWEAELAAQRELEEDDHAWYARNPHRCPWTLKKNAGTLSRSRVGSEERGAQDGDSEGIKGYNQEKFPTKTNRMLFADYVGRYFQDLKTTLAGSNEGEAAVPRPASDKPDTAVCGSEDDWQEDLFSPTRGRRRSPGKRDNLDHDSYSCASSMESYSSLSESSMSSEEKSLDFEVDVAPVPLLPAAPIGVLEGMDVCAPVQPGQRNRGLSLRSVGISRPRKFSFLRLST
ncbi:hypothetical protein CVT26_003785 [Gymnopilus dilepis]|uniref:Uncharacterized protein n=1 Tax=Gymnopilus dilepis TaxID=231916 RepID=A0A409W1N7_9AGAR|nr:hypothetical protein CVT26_003785 [Gymnopilus dilepis]